ncbi:MAG: hypothetical protein V1914_01465 [archaeon]
MAKKIVKKKKGKLSKKEEKILEDAGFDMGPFSEEEQELLRQYEENSKKNYKVWEVSYNYHCSFERFYDCSFERFNERSTDTYYIVAESIGKAEEKANELFLKGSFKRRLFENGEVRRCIREYVVDVPFPDLTLEEDVNGFFLEPRFSSDGALAKANIEYVVGPYLVKRK